jgi:MerR family transcriptional regulator, copper efflux regulator
VTDLTVSEAASRTGWSPRMLRYLEGAGLVVPGRTRAGYRLYGVRELNQLRSLGELRRQHGVELDELAFALRLRRNVALRAAVETWLAGVSPATDAAAAAWVEWEQRKHERLLVA